MCYENSCGKITEAADSFFEAALRNFKRLKNPPYLLLKIRRIFIIIFFLLRRLELPDQLVPWI